MVAMVSRKNNATGRQRSVIGVKVKDQKEDLKISHPSSVIRKNVLWVVINQNHICQFISPTVHQSSSLSVSKTSPPLCVALATNSYRIWQNISHNAVLPPTDLTFIIVSFAKRTRLSTMWWWNSYALREQQDLDEMSDNFTCHKILQDRPTETFPIRMCLWNGVSRDEWGADPSGPQTLQTGPHAEAHILTDHPQRGGPQYWQEMTSAATLSIMVISIIIGFYSMTSLLQT